ncbi:BatD family protein, partial [Mesonia hippocampi]|uniref:BatD family protein n=1 Tax=Mesonia hippocampi TaxID=1628250 RepID=UPI003F9A3D9E
MKKLITLLLLTTFHFQSCSGQNKEFVRFVVQPEAEVGKSILFNIYFEQKPDSIIVASNYVDGLELTYNLDEILKRISSSNTTDENGEIIQTYYSFESYAIPTKTGRIDLPVLTVIHEGKEYKSKPLHINVVDNITIDQNDLKVSWTSDKATYNKNDTIKVSLYEYSRFFETKRKYLPPENLPSLKGKENEIHVGFEETID